MTKRLIVVGAGGHAKVVVDTAVVAGWTIEGLTVLRSSVEGHRVLGFPVLGDDAALNAYPVSDVALAIGVGALPLRREIFERLRSRGYEFPPLIHPRAVVASSVTVGDGVQIMAGAVVQPDAFIGMNTIVNTAASIDHDCVLESHVFIGPGAVLAGEVKVGTGAFLGTGAIVLPQMSIAEGAVVAAGAVVTADVAAGETVIGIPARAQVTRSQSVKLKP